MATKRELAAEVAKLRRRLEALELEVAGLKLLMPVAPQQVPFVAPTLPGPPWEPLKVTCCGAPVKLVNVVKADDVAGHWGEITHPVFIPDEPQRMTITTAQGGA